MNDSNYDYNHSQNQPHPELTSKESLYSTKDTALAAWLYCKEFELVKVDTSVFPTIFYFRNDIPDLQKFVHMFEVGVAEGNVVLFFRGYKTMLSKIKDNGRRRGNER